MFNRLLMTIATAACLMGVYAFYAVLTRPLVVIPELPTTSSEPRSQGSVPLQENVRVATTYLSEQRWAADSAYMFRSGEAYIFTQSWSHQAGDTRIKFTPFAMVWVQKDRDGREQAVSMVSDSALLRFASAFDEVRPNPGRVVGAVLDGEVQIKGPDGLAIVGKQFVFDESAPSLVSTNPVEFWYASHHGHGRSLNVKLIPAEGPPGRDRPHVFGIRTIRLGSGINPATREFEPVWLVVRMPQQGQQKPVRIHARDLEYDVSQNVAQFSQSVRAYSKTEAAGWDSLECDDLLLRFRPVPAKSADVETVAAKTQGIPDPRQFQQIETDLEFHQLEATGKLVKIKSDQQNLRAWMQRMEYDMVKHQLKLTDPREVHVAFKGSILKVPSVDVRLREDNAIDEIICQGIGRLEMTQPVTNDLAFVAQWGRQLRLVTNTADGHDLIELEHQASFRQPQQRTGLGAELIRLWVAPLSLNVNSASNQNAPGASSVPQPARLIAARDVVLVSPQLLARTAELDVHFDEPKEPRLLSRRMKRNQLQQVSLEESGPTTVRKPPRDASAGSSSRQPGVATHANAVRPKVQGAGFSTTRPEPGSLGQPIDISGSDDTAGRAKLQTVSTREPLDVRADWIGVHMQTIEGEPEPELLEVESRGRVKIMQKQAGNAPFTAEGDRLQLQNHGLGREVVHLFGQPAHLRDPRMHVEGREVHLDRQANRVWVNGNGLLQLPLPEGTSIGTLREGISSRGDNSTSPATAKSPGTKLPDLDVWWGESMEFDGLTAKFIGKITAELGLSRMRCEQMDVKLDSRLSFTDLEARTQPELASVNCREDVTFENSEYEGNKLVGVQRGSVAEFTVKNLKSETVAQGPGHIEIWMRDKRSTDNGNLDTTGPRAMSRANRPISTVASGWNYTRVDFKGKMTGKIDSQRSTFHDGVWIVHGPVGRPNDKINRDKLPADAGSMRCEELQFANHSADDDHPVDYQEMVGRGNAEIEGRGFYANADEICYDGSKGSYMLRAHGNQSATIARDAERGTRQETSGRRIEFIKSTNTVKVDWANGGSQ